VILGTGKTIVPYSSIPFRQNDCPALKHFFRCTEGAGVNISLHDDVGGIVLGPSTYTAPDAYSVGPTSNNDNKAFVSGAWVQPNSNKMLIMMVGDFVNGVGGYFGLGYSFTGIQELMLHANFVGSDVFDGTTRIVGNACTAVAGTVVAVGMLVDFSGNLTTFYTTAAGAYTANAGAAMTGVTGISVLPNYSSQGGSTYINKLYGIAVFHFTGAFPDDVAAAIAWMTANWKVGNKVVYPGWKDIS
jgi:hypothetical protein